MNILLDTHAFLWFDNESEKLSGKAREACLNLENRLYLSVASIWEIQIKHQLNRLELPSTLDALIQGQVQGNQLRILPIKPRHIYNLEKLEFHHRDPFDRMLIAQAHTENLTLMSVDSQMDKYQSLLELIW